MSGQQERMTIRLGVGLVSVIFVMAATIWLLGGALGGSAATTTRGEALTGPGDTAAAAQEPPHAEPAAQSPKPAPQPAPAKAETPKQPAKTKEGGDQPAKPAAHPAVVGKGDANAPLLRPGDCAACHACAQPTAEEPCLQMCSRPRTQEVEAELEASGVAPPGVILLDMLSSRSDAKDHFGPVPFDHAGHARWSDIAGGCTVCHHYTPEGTDHPACRSCHEIAFKHDDLGKPGLKGAYHRQCLGCHREWSHETKCDLCHVPRLDANGNDRGAKTITKDDVMGMMQHPIPAPELERIPADDYPPGKGSVVYFNHGRHSKLYGFKCAECHQGDSCARCHEYGKQHDPCSEGMCHKACERCHQVDSDCEHCHLEKGAAAPPSFDHARTGWPLARYHQGNRCRDCHKEVPFEKPEHACNRCHDPNRWQPGDFDHAVTGQRLSETHEEVDCADCHAERKFSVAPRCDECHDEDEVSFPAQRPGPVVPPAP